MMNLVCMVNHKHHHFNFNLVKRKSRSESLIGISRIEYLPDEKCFFILNPFDVVKAESRDYDDHIDYFIERKRFTQAIEAFENPPSASEKPRRHT